jgi:hypothetical protein
MNQRVCNQAPNPSIERTSQRPLRALWRRRSCRTFRPHFPKAMSPDDPFRLLSLALMVASLVPVAVPLAFAFLPVCSPCSKGAVRGVHLLAVLAAPYSTLRFSNRTCAMGRRTAGSMPRIQGWSRPALLNLLRAFTQAITEVLVLRRSGRCSRRRRGWHPFRCQLFFLGSSCRGPRMLTVWPNPPSSGRSKRPLRALWPAAHVER